MKSPAITITIDDCQSEDTRVLSSALKSNSLIGVFYVITDLVGKNLAGIEFANWDSLLSIAKDGNEIGSHSCTHRGAGLKTIEKMERFGKVLKNDGLRRSIPRTINAMTSKKESFGIEHLSQFNEINNSKNDVEKHLGRECKTYSYPGGGCTEALKSIIKDANYSTARTGYPGYNKPGHFDCYELRAQIWDNSVSSEKANKWVDKAIEENLWLIEVFHTIDNLDYLYNTTSGELSRHLRYVSSRAKEIENLTMSEVL